MKRFIYFMLGLALVAGGFTSCSDDDDNGSVSMPASPAKDIVGVYSGQWTRVALTNNDSTITSGTVTLTTQTDSLGNVLDYVGNVTVGAASAVGITEMSSIVNVSWNANNVYTFFNYVTSDANGLGMSFAGTVKDTQEMSFSFKKTVRSGRKTSDYMYYFVGTKQ